MINMATRTREKDGCQYIASSRLYVFLTGDVNADANDMVAASERNIFVVIRET